MAASSFALSKAPGAPAPAAGVLTLPQPASARLATPAASATLVRECNERMARQCAAAVGPSSSGGVLDRVGVVQKHHVGRVLAGELGFHLAVGHDDHLVARLDEAGGGAVDADGLGAARRFDGIGGEAG